MKKVITKSLILIVVAIILINFVFISNTSFAADVKKVRAETVINTMANIIGGIISIVLYLKKLMIVIMAFCVNTISGFIGKMDGVINGGSFVVLTPFEIFFNKLQIIDINFFDLSIPSDTTTYTIRTVVSNWFYVMRLIAVSILLLILIYVGIRMAISSIAEDKAKYKKMLVDWACSMALVFVLQYIAIFTIYANQAIIRALEKLSTSTDISTVINDIAIEGALGIGINAITSAAVYCLLTLQIVGLLIAYINRMLKVAFLIIISPLISITYSIDKMGDGKSQVLDTWLKEFVYTVLIQPFHCIIYIALIGTAFNLIINGETDSIFAALGNYNQLANGILAILCVKFTKDAEGIVRKIFGFKDDNDSTSMVAGVALTMAAMKNSKNLGKSAREFGSKAGGLAKAVGADFNHLKGKDNAIGRFANKLSNGASVAKNKVGGKFKGLKDGASKKISGAKGKLKDSKLGKALGPKLDSLKKSKLANFIAKRNGLGGAIGAFAGLAAYGAGESALSSFGIAKKTEKESQEFIDTTKGNVESSVEGQEKEKNEALTEATVKDYQNASNDLETAEEALEEARDGENEEELEEEINEEEKEIEEEEKEIADEEESATPEESGNLKERRNKLEERRNKLEERKKKLENINKKKQARDEAKERRDEAKERKDKLEKELKPKTVEEIAANGVMYSDGSEYFKALLRSLEVSLSRIGQEDRMQTITLRIEKEAPLGVKIEEILETTLDVSPIKEGEEGYEEYQENREAVFDSAMDLRQYNAEKAIYNTMQRGASAGTSVKAVIEKIQLERKKQEKKGKK